MHAAAYAAPARSIQHTTCNMQRKTCSVHTILQHATYSMQRTPCVMLQRTPYIQHARCSIQRAIAADRIGCRAARTRHRSCTRTWHGEDSGTGRSGSGLPSCERSRGNVRWYSMVSHTAWYPTPHGIPHRMFIPHSMLIPHRMFIPHSTVISAGRMGLQLSGSRGATRAPTMHWRRDEGGKASPSVPVLLLQ